MKNCKTNRRPPTVKPSPCGKNYFLQNKLPAVSRQAEPLRKKLLFAKQTAGGESSSRLPLTPAIAGNYHRTRG